FIYFSVAVFDDGTTSGPSNFFPILAVNYAPVAAADPAVGTSYSMDQGATLTLPTPGLLANDTDVDSATLTAKLVSGPSNATSFTLNANGSFSYAPSSTFVGTDSFTYSANDVDPNRSS